MMRNLLLIVCLVFITNTALSVDKGFRKGLSKGLSGEVKLDGAIFETPCAILMEAFDQTIELEAVPESTLEQWEHGERFPFLIHVVDCQLHSYDGEVRPVFTITFEGPSEKHGFSVTGAANGIALALDDAKGRLIQPGQKASSDLFAFGITQLEYGLRIVKNDTDYIPGDFQGILRFKLDYY